MKPRSERQVEPVPEGYDPDEVFDPRTQARPSLAAWLALGPVLSAIGTVGWLRLIGGVPLPLPESPDGLGLLLDFLLLLFFLLPHSLLARGSGRRLLNLPFGPGAERPLYVLISGFSLCLLVLLWHTSGPMLWNHEGAGKLLSRLVQGLGLLLAAWGTLVSGSGRLLGLPHLRAIENGTQAPSPELVALPPYRWLRQPVNLGILLLFLGMPEGSPDRLLLGVVLGLWILISAPYEERDAEPTFGSAYRRYKERTPRWIPRFREPEEGGEEAP